MKDPLRPYPASVGTSLVPAQQCLVVVLSLRMLDIIALRPDAVLGLFFSAMFGLYSVCLYDVEEVVLRGGHCSVPPLVSMGSFRRARYTPGRIVFRPRWGPWIAPSNSRHLPRISVWVPAVLPSPICVGFKFYGGPGREFPVYATAIIGG
ncbi:hypothetical protein NDU88_001872 [Pleurodeles waltl]|uniref:Uncharacterized protein n=1 Tax=Pleurodeles waltl TaxID=8319 RepID=A0AAV7ML12_PLEWA|nr:hypothetical protein NDU88_001872 [Pleurodeles waltl]